MRKKALVLSLFGVLYQDRWKEWLKENRVPLEKFLSQGPIPFVKELLIPPTYPHYYEELMRKNADESICSVTDDQLYETLSKASNVSVKNLREIIHDKSVLNDDIFSLVRHLRTNNIKIGLIGNSSREITQEFLEVRSLEQFFDVTITYSETDLRKSNPIIFIKVAEALHLSTDEILFLEDSIETAEIMRKLKIPNIYYHGQTFHVLREEIEKNY